MKPRLVAHGGVRPNSGRKAQGFQKKCAELAVSPKFFEFAKSVFNRDKVEPRLTKDGEVIYLEASVGDMVYLWEKLAAYGFGKPIDFDASQLIAPLQKVINDTNMLKAIYGLNDIQGAGGRRELGPRAPEVQAPDATA